MPAWIGAAAAVAVLAVLALWYFRPAAARSPKQVTVAVLPFSNLGASHDRDFLALALPDELITILSHSHALAVRPFVMTKKYTGDVDPQKVGRDLKVDDVITGDFRSSGSGIGISVESIDVEKNDVLWRDSVEIPGSDLIAVRDALSQRIRSGLLPSLHVAVQSEADRPQNDEAYTLFMKASALPNDPAPNKQALAMLQRAVALDPSYAPALTALSSRYYLDAEYSDGGEPARRRSEEAARRALSLDPDLLAASRRIIIIETESGDLAAAYRDAKAFLARRPDSADSHFSMSYVLRFAGLLDQAANECETARALDPHNFAWRSCSLTFLRAGDLDRARQFAALDGKSSWHDTVSSFIFLRAGDRAEAIRSADAAVASGSDGVWIPVMQAFLQHRPQTEIDQAAKAVQTYTRQEHDSESVYFAAEWLGYSGEPAMALDGLRLAIAKGYCSVPSVEHDPGFVDARKLPQYEEVRKAGEACQQRFLAARTP